MNKKYVESVDVIDVEVLDIQGITAVITIEIKGKKLNCFISEFHNKEYFKGESCVVLLSLMTTKLEKISSEDKSITPTEHFEAHCTLSGEIKEFFPIVHKYYKHEENIWYEKEQPSYKHGIVDCGIFVAVEIRKDSDLKVGDYIVAEGRLDASKVQEENL